MHSAAVRFICSEGFIFLCAYACVHSQALKITIQNTKLLITKQVQQVMLLHSASGAKKIKNYVIDINLNSVPYHLV
jgi:hypothetical protein